MAMLGKRFQRTISMSQIGPGNTLHAEKAQAHPASLAESAQKGISAGRPLVLNDQHLLLQAATTQWEALRSSCIVQQDDHHHHHQKAAATNQWEAMKVNCGGVQEDHHQQPAAGVDQWEILKSAEAMMMMMMQAGQSSSTQEEPSDDDPTMATQSMDPHMHMGPWPHLMISPSAPHPPQYSLIPRVDFLDSCFFCKRRLRHERDIFIYRGDAAFCTEECRQRQILSDETHSKKQGGATSETAVAA